MVDELKKFIENQKVFFGIKECLKRSEDLKSIIVSSDCRDEIKKLLSANKLKFETSEFVKGEIANKLGMEFKCEVFGIKK